MEKVTLHIEGMSCGHCEIAIQDAIRKLPGIKKAKASKRKKQAVVDYDASLVSVEQVIEAVKNTGYIVVGEA
ncbi:heavy-metal-associated domain-containing protein [Lachnospiraceae bacterium ZAX-1]